MVNATLLDRIASWALSVRLESLSPAVVSAAQTLVIDTIACALAGHACEPARRVLRVIQNGPGAMDATVLGTRDRTSLMDAVLANGTLIRALDFNDFYWGPGQMGHPSDNLAVTFAVAEKRARSGADVICSMIVGYELSCRMQDLMDPDGPWDYVIVSGLAASAMAAHLMRLDVRQFAEALALGAVHGHALSATRHPQIAEGKASANARVARDAVLAALLAEQGTTGPRAALEGRFGLPAVLRSQANLEHLLPRPGDSPKILDVALKAFPCIGTGQSAIAAALELRERYPDCASSFTRFAVHLVDKVITRQQQREAFRRPDSHGSADHSFYFLVAVALVDGEVTPKQFERERWRDPSIIAVMDRIELHLDHPPVAGSPFPAVLVATPREGNATRIEVPFPPGHPRNPLGLKGLARKLGGCMGAATTPSQRDRIMSLGADLSKLDSLAPLMQALAGTAPGAHE